MDENQSLIAFPNDNGGKKKKAFVFPVVTAFSTVLLLGLFFYVGEYWGSHRARDDALIPIDGWCYDHPNNCIIPPDLSQPAFCFCSSSDHKACWCQSGQPGEYCDETSDCLIPKGLDHSVCRFGGGDAQCQSGQPGALCGQTSDCVIQTRLDPPHAVCRKGKCQR